MVPLHTCTHAANKILLSHELCKLKYGYCECSLECTYTVRFGLIFYYEYRTRKIDYFTQAPAITFPRVY